MTEYTGYNDDDYLYSQLIFYLIFQLVYISNKFHPMYKMKVTPRVNPKPMNNEIMREESFNWDPFDSTLLPPRSIFFLFNSY